VRNLHLRGTAGQITVFGKNGRTRSIALPTDLWTELTSRRGAAGPEDLVFRSRTGKSLDRGRVRVIIRRAVQRVSVTELVSPHWLRHAHASHALDRGAPIHLVQATLGHSSVATTSRYLHARPGDSSARFLALDRIPVESGGIDLQAFPCGVSTGLHQRRGGKKMGLMVNSEKGEDGARGVRHGTYAVEPLAKRKVASLKLGFGGDIYGYSIDLGYPPPPPPATMFGLDPHVKRECLWHGRVYRKASALVDRRNNLVWLATTRDQEPLMLTQHLSDTDSMLASVADPQRAPEMLEVREAIRYGVFTKSRMISNESHATVAEAGMVSTHAQRMLVARPHRTALSRCTDPTPAIAPAITCVVDTGWSK